MSTRSLFLLGMLLLALSAAGLIFASIQPAPLTPHQELTALMAGEASTPVPGAESSTSTPQVASLVTPVSGFTPTGTPLPLIVTPQAQPSPTPIAVLYPTYQAYQPPIYSLPPQPPVPERGWMILGRHVVQPGESLYCIGRAYTIDPRAIATMNGLSLNQVLVPGMVLRVPDVSWLNIPPGPVCQTQFSVSVAILTPTPQASTPATSQPAATPTSASPINSASALPASVPTPSPLLLRVEAEWPVKMWANESDFVRLSLIRGASPVVSATSEVADHQTIVAPVATPIGTPDAPPAQALGPQYKVCAAAYLIGKAFEPKLTTLECQSLDRDELEWEWSVLTNQLGTQYLHFNVVLRWVQETTGTEIIQQIWHYSARVEIEQPWIVPGQLTVLPIFGSIIGGSLTLPYLSERMKKRMN